MFFISLLKFSTTISTKFYDLFYGLLKIINQFKIKYVANRWVYFSLQNTIWSLVFFVNTFLWIRNHFCNFFFFKHLMPYMTKKQHCWKEIKIIKHCAFFCMKFSRMVYWFAKLLETLEAEPDQIQLQWPTGSSSFHCNGDAF